MSKLSEWEKGKLLSQLAQRIYNEWLDKMGKSPIIDLSEDEIESLILFAYEQGQEEVNDG